MDLKVLFIPILAHLVAEITGFIFVYIVSDSVVTKYLNCAILSRDPEFNILNTITAEGDWRHLQHNNHNLYNSLDYDTVLSHQHHHLCQCR